MPTLYIVATPIGNLEDITLRALRTLREVDLIAAEDTRHSGKLLKHFEIDTPMTSFHDFSDEYKLNQLVDRLIGEDIALISDAGTPSISDPGFRLVRAAVAAGYTVVPIPGANAAISALVASGMATDSFLFLGFLPQKEKGRRDALQAVAELPHTLVLYESPKRLLKLLADVEAVLGSREVCVAREITKLHEEIWRGEVGNSAEYFNSQPKIRGEITVVISGSKKQTISWDEAAVSEKLLEVLATGVSRKQAAEEVAKLSGWRKKAIYNLNV